MIPQADPAASLRECRAEVETAIRRVLDSGRFVGGPEVEAFETAFARALGVPHAAGVASGTDALHLALRALGAGSGDAVVLPALTASATASAVVQAGARPVFADVRDDDLTMDAETAAAAGKARILLPVHLHGNPADLAGLRALAGRTGARILEDCAQAHGAARDGRPCGTWGDASAFSFYPTKNLGALGDAGLVATADPALAERVRLLREYGWRERQVSASHGVNSRLDPLQAAVLGARLPRLASDNARRLGIAGRYAEGLSGIVRLPPMPAPGRTPCFHQFVVRHPDRDRLREHLERSGIGTAVHYPVPLHRQGAYGGPDAPALPVAERACREMLSLPIYPGLSDLDADAVAAAVRAFGGRRG